MEHSLLSVGIDIGTTTTQLVFSRLTVGLQTGGQGFPHIAGRQLLYRSQIHYTPLSTPSKVDASALADLIQTEYSLAGISASDVHSGAVIITGETARKENAAAISSALSLAAGKFVVATAGPELEGLLAGQGAGAGILSKKITGKVINFDIGGGTTNASVFFDGRAETAFALDIGGRLIRFHTDRTVCYISERLTPLLAAMNLPIAVGCRPRLRDLYTLCRRLASILLDYVNGGTGGSDAQPLLISPPPPPQTYPTFMFSGGVAEYIYQPPKSLSWKNIMAYQDIGILLGKCIHDLFKSAGITPATPQETIRATVIGAGVYSMSLSGNTVCIDKTVLPLRDIPVLKLPEDFYALPEAGRFIAAKLSFYKEVPAALAFRGPKSPRYQELKQMAKHLASAFALAQREKDPVIIILEHDFAKALGQALRLIMPDAAKIVCIDRIIAEENSYIDIGQPIDDMLPVVVKTLAFH